MILSVYSLCSFLLLPPFFANISFHFHWTIYPVNQGLAWTELAFYTGTLHKFVRFGAMDVTKPNPGAIERFGAMDITEHRKSRGVGDKDVTKPCEFIGFGVIDVTKPMNL